MLPPGAVRIMRWATFAYTSLIADAMLSIPPFTSNETERHRIRVRSPIAGSANTMREKMMLTTPTITRSALTYFRRSLAIPRITRLAIP